MKISQKQVNNLETDIASKAPLDSPDFTGTPKAPTAALGSNDSQIATTSYVDGTLSDVLSQTGTVGMKADTTQTSVSNTAIRIKIGNTYYYVPATTGGSNSITIGTCHGSCHGSCHGNCHGNCHGHCAGMKGVGI